MAFCCQWIGTSRRNGKQRNGSDRQTDRQTSSNNPTFFKDGRGHFNSGANVGGANAQGIQYQPSAVLESVSLGSCSVATWHTTNKDAPMLPGNGAECAFTGDSR